MSLNSNQQLRKILELESKKGYSDTAVIGGLDRYLSHITTEGDSSGQEIPAPFPSYTALNHSQRANWVGEVLQGLAERGRQPASLPPRPTPSVLGAPVSTLKGVHTATTAKFHKLGITTVGDLLYFFPRRYNDFSTIKPIAKLTFGATETINGLIWEIASRRSAKGRILTEAIVGDDTGNLKVIWFNQPYLERKLLPNTQVVLSGRVEVFRGQKVIHSPEYEPWNPEDLTHAGRIVPVYPLTEGMPARTVRRLMKEALEMGMPHLSDDLPSDIRARRGLLDLRTAIGQIHFPENEEVLERARKRLAFDELFFLQLRLIRNKQRWQEEQAGHAMPTDSGLLQAYLSSLPFTLTDAQQQVLMQILDDMARGKPMSRLLQGEVGSGKTVVALGALLIAVANGFQGVLMAPTEVLAEQHYKSIAQLLSQGKVPEAADLKIQLLTGSTTKGEREKILEGLNQGLIHIVIGTHAVIQVGVSFHRLGLAIIDEQHRFGVMQRGAMRQKGYNPHVLVMTATPIPRTLALSLYGDLDISVIDQIPPGRQPVSTRVLSPNQRHKAYEFVRRQAHEGRQTFVICPLIEESEKIEARAATKEYVRLSTNVFPDLRLGLLHGRMKAADKEKIMSSFRAGQLDILVSTSVVEVGIDIPNATVILVEGAERFGLSQLHQLRGRVGRGEHPSFCLLVEGVSSMDGRRRLSLMEKTNDGFRLAEEDMQMRGPGDVWGTRQSGWPDLRIATLSDLPLLETAREEAIQLLRHDPVLAQYPALTLRLSKALKEVSGDLS